MKLSALLNGVEARMVGEAAFEITGLSFDSRQTQPGHLFCAMVGTHTDGHAYADLAVARGAAALMVERALPIDIPQVVVDDTRKAFARVCANFFGRPADRLKLVSVTGTNGKTSTTYMLHTALQSAGQKTGLIGTICLKSGERILGESLTTPEPFTLHRLLRLMADDGCRYAAMEVSSHALAQARVEGLCFDAAIFTNLTQDHLDYHGTIERYAAEKKKLFSQCAVGVFNLDDPYAGMMMEGAACEVVTYAIEKKADYNACDIECTAAGVGYTLIAGDERARIELGIPGLFTVYNSLGAAAALMRMGLPIEAVANGLRRVATVPGRAEVVPTGDHPFTVILDYAHTPDGLENILLAVRGFARGRVIAVFGCGGDRDPSKREKMGYAAGAGADFCIVTSDNPRTEDPQRIIDAIVPGVERSGCAFEVVVNRVQAIGRALDCAREGDVIVLAGKGHEPYQEIHGVRHPFDEKAIVAQALLAMGRTP